MKPLKGTIDNWYKYSFEDDRYIICGVFKDHPEFRGHSGHTSEVLHMSEDKTRIETRNSRYYLGKPHVKHQISAYEKT